MYQADYGNKKDWFPVDQENIRNIQKRGYYGKDGIQEGYWAKYCGDGFEVISDQDYADTFGNEEPER